MTSLPPTTGGPLTPAQYALLNFQGKTIDEASELMTQISERRDVHAANAQTAQEMIDDEIANGNPSGPDALKDLNQERDENRKDASYYDEAITYATEHADDLGIVGASPVAEPAHEKSSKLKSVGLRAGGWAKEHPVKAGLAAAAAVTVAVLATNGGDGTRDSLEGQSCNVDESSAVGIGIQEAKTQPDMAAAVASAHDIIDSRGADCTSEAKLRFYGFAQDGVRLELGESAGVASTTAPEAQVPTENAPTTTANVPSSSLTTPEVEQGAAADIDDTVFCSPDGEVVGVTVGKDGIVEDYSGDSCEYPGAGVEVQRNEPGGGNDLVVGMGL